MMSETKRREGKCLCGVVHIAGQSTAEVGACHCKTCRRWSGGPFMEVNCGADVTIEGEDKVTVFDSSEWAERGFCSVCGTHLFYRLKGNGMYIVPVGLFDDDPDLTFATQVFIDEKPGYYRFAEATKDLTGAEVFAMFGSSD